MYYAGRINRELVTHSGFYYAANKARKMEIVVTFDPQNIPNYPEKKEKMKKLLGFNLNSTTKSIYFPLDDSQPPKELLIFFRILLLAPEQVKLPNLNVAEKINDDMEKIAVREISNLCNELLSFYPTKFESDLEIDLSTVSFVRRNLILLRMEEKMILKRTIKKLNSEKLEDSDWNYLLKYAPKIEETIEEKKSSKEEVVDEKKEESSKEETKESDKEKPKSSPKPNHDKKKKKKKSKSKK